jgi:hypothetical protein
VSEEQHKQKFTDSGLFVAIAVLGSPIWFFMALVVYLAVLVTFPIAGVLYALLGSEGTGWDRFEKIVSKIPMGA